MACLRYTGPGGVFPPPAFARIFPFPGSLLGIPRGGAPAWPWAGLGGRGWLTRGTGSARRETWRGTDRGPRSEASCRGLRAPPVASAARTPTAAYGIGRASFARLWGARDRKFSGNLLVFVSQAHLPHGNCARDVARARGWSELDQRVSSPAPDLGLPGCANSAQLLLRGKGASVGLVTGRSRVATRRLSDEPGGYGLQTRRPDGVYGGLGDPGCGALLFHDRGSIARGRRAHCLQAGAEHQVNR